MTDGVEVSVVLPAYNEEDTIERTVQVSLDALASFLPDDAFEVIVAEDGCDDRTPEIATRMAEEDDRVRHFHSDERLGRGGALEFAFERAAGDTLVYYDTDLATDMKHLEELVESVRSGESDLATGSRWLPENRADRPAKRAVSSLGFNTLVRLFLRSDLQDHQCGFKAVSREAFETLQSAVEDEHWFWDTEMLVRAQREGFRVKEFAVDWEPKGDTKVDLVRDVFGMGSQIVRTWWQLSVSPKITPRRSFAAGATLFLVAIALMPLYIDPAEQVVDEIVAADPVLVAVAGLVYAVSWPLRGHRYRDILVELGYRETTGFLTGAVFISQTGNLVFPARAGDAVRAYVIKVRRAIPYPSGFASLAAERVFDLLTIATLAGTVLLGLAATGGVTDIVQSLADATLPGNKEVSGQQALWVATGVGAAAIGAVAVIVASAYSDRNFAHAVVSRFSDDSYADYLAGVVEQFGGDVQTVSSDPRAFARIGASSLLIWTIDVLTAVVVLAAMGHAVTPVLLAVSFFAVSVGNLAKVLPLTPAGLGLYEGAFALIVVAMTPIGGWVAIAVAVLDHLVKNAVTLLGGLVSMAWLNVSLTTAVEESRSASEVDTDADAVGE
jgi:uncharacterized membrane protein YbhN (UPF0104 family)